MSCEIFKVSPKTLEKLRELSLDKETSIREVIEIAVNDYYDKNCATSVKLILTDDEEFYVNAKKEHSNQIKELTGVKGPYKVTKTCRSQLGLSDGVYKLENCDILLPVSYFDKANKRFDIMSVTLIFCWILALLQSGLLIYWLPLI